MRNVTGAQSSAGTTTENTRICVGTTVATKSTATVADRAGALQPAQIRTLDAIHLASAELVADEIGAFVTYDFRVADAARALGLRVAAPAPASTETSAG